MEVYTRNLRLIYCMAKILCKDCWNLLFYYATNWNLRHDEFLKLVFIVITIISVFLVLSDFLTVFGILYILYVFVKFHVLFYKQAVNESKKCKNKQKKYEEKHEFPDDTTLFCLICMSRERSILTLPCKHVSMCDVCSKKITQNRRDCPICNQRIKYNIRIYFS